VQSNSGKDLKTGRYGELTSRPSKKIKRSLLSMGFKMPSKTKSTRIKTDLMG
jgi:hypothetical protein